MNTTPISAREVRDWWKANAERYGTRTNPRDQGLCTSACLYTRGEDHCLIGQFLADTNRDLPDPASYANSYGIDRLLTDGEYPYEDDDTYWYLVDLQCNADRADTDWATAYSRSVNG